MNTVKFKVQIPLTWAEFLMQKYNMPLTDVIVTLIEKEKERGEQKNGAKNKS